MRFLVCFFSLMMLGWMIPSIGYSQEATSTTASLDLRIPVVDMNDFYTLENRETFLNTLYDAMSTVGFFAVRNTGVNAAVIKEAYAQAETFFKSSPEFKASCFKEGVKGERGFVPGETAKGNKIKDFKEFYHFGREGALPPNVWPQQMGFKNAIMNLFEELEQYVVPLQEAIIATINLHSTTQIPLDYLNQTTKEGQSLLRSAYYPAMSEEMINNLDEPQDWAAAHTDIDLLTILPFATEKGLQVEVDGEWLNVVVPADAFIVNIGDMLQNLTNGLFKSATHRVRALEPNKDRFSMVFFVHPTDETPLDPLPACIEITGGKPEYAKGTRQEFLWERLLEIRAAPELLSLYAKTGHTERQMELGRESPQVVQMLVENNLASAELLKALESQPADYYTRTRTCACQ
jgi:isopenicillin N synthase-like dioxygenase